MPQYPGVAGATKSVANNNQVNLEKGESHYVVGVLATTATQLPVNDGNVATENFAGPSMSVNLEAGSEADSTILICVEIAYPSAPGAGEVIAIQEADTDADAFFITPTNSAYTVNAFSANNVARVDLSPTGGKFMRINRTKGANAVGCTVKITRLR